MGPGTARQGRPRRLRAALLLFVALLLHNAEEGVSYAASRPKATQLVRLASPTLELPTPVAFQSALFALTVAVGAALAWAAHTQREREAWWALKLTAWVLLANVVVPHVPAAIVLGGYAPGVVTAVFINLPLAVWVLRQRPNLPSSTQSTHS